MPAFFIPCNPPKATAQQKGIMVVGGKPRHFKKKHVREAENDLLSLLSPYRPNEPVEGPVLLTVLWIYPWRSGEKKKNRALGFLPSDKRPDTDNILKMLKDCLGRLLFWHDDSQVAFEQMLKGWGDRPGFGIVVSPLPDGVGISDFGRNGISGHPIDTLISAREEAYHGKV